MRSGQTDSSNILLFGLADPPRIRQGKRPRPVEEVLDDDTPVVEDKMLRELTEMEKKAREKKKAGKTDGDPGSRESSDGEQVDRSKTKRSRLTYPVRGNPPRSSQRSDGSPQQGNGTAQSQRKDTDLDGPGDDGPSNGQSRAPASR